MGLAFNRKAMLLGGLVLAVALLPAAASAEVVVPLLEKTYLRGTGAPVTVTDPFVALPGTATLTVVTGGSVTSAIVEVNGIEVFGTEHFKQAVSELVAEVSVGETNTISVEARGEPGATLTAWVVQVVEADGAAVVTPESGGVVEVTDPSSPLQGARLEIPAGSIQQSVVISLTTPEAVPPFPQEPTLGAESLVVSSLLMPSEAEARNVISPVNVGPDGLSFEPPATLVLPFSEDWLDEDEGLGAASLSVYGFHPTTSSWVGTASSVLNQVLHTVAALIDRSRLYGLQEDRIECQPEGSDGHLPVLLLHGIMSLEADLTPLTCSSGTGDTFGELASRLSADAYVCEILYNTARRIEVNAELLRTQWTDEILMRAETDLGTRPAGVTVIAHSMGGLISRYAVQFYPEDPEPIHRLVTLATPHLGSHMTPAGLCESTEQMRPGSELLEGPWPSSEDPPTSGLNWAIRDVDAVPELPGCDPDYYLFAGNSDGVVFPQSAKGQEWHFIDPLTDLPVTVPAIFERAITESCV